MNFEHSQIMSYPSISIVCLQLMSYIFEATAYECSLTINIGDFSEVIVPKCHDCMLGSAWFHGV